MEPLKTLQISLFFCVLVSSVHVSMEQNNQRFLKFCCAIEKTDEVNLKCLREEVAHYNFARRPCVRECELKTKGYLVGEKEIDFEAVRRDLAERYPEDHEYATLYEDSLRECYEFLHNIPENEQHACSRFSFFLLDCVYEQIFVKCPADRWHNGPVCNNLQKFTAFASMLALYYADPDEEWSY